MIDSGAFLIRSIKVLYENSSFGLWIIITKENRNVEIKTSIGHLEKMFEIEFLIINLYNRIIIKLNTIK